jgi:hypothetical protein
MRKQAKPSKQIAAFNITSAPKSLTHDQAGRQRRYFISMMIRTVCFILTVLLPSPFRWFALLGAVTLPYIAVVVANAGRETIIPGASILKNKSRELD